MARKKKTQAPPQEDARTQEFLDMIVPSVIKFNTDHCICGSTRNGCYRRRKQEIEADASDQLPNLLRPKRADLIKIQKSIDLDIVS